jgi:NADH dehydrogenase [ubiquinone] 1 alpha subcomplex assembly factor 6
MLKLKLNKPLSFFYAKNYLHTGNKNFDHCINLVKTNDYENYLCTMLLPKEIMRSAFALRAFNIEISNVSASTRDAKIGLMRYKFWKDRLDTMYKQQQQSEFNLAGEPITNELMIAIKQNKLSKIWLSRLIESREFQMLNKTTYQTVKDVENFGEYTVSPIYYLLLECMNIKNVNCDHVSSHLSKSQILANLVRSIPAQSRANLSLIPIELLVKHKISQNEIIKLTYQQKIEKNENFKDLIYNLCNLSNQHLMKARKLNNEIPSNVNILFLNSINIESFLKKIEKYNFDITNKNLHLRDAFTPFKLYYAKFRNKY